MHDYQMTAAAARGLALKDRLLWAAVWSGAWVALAVLWPFASVVKWERARAWGLKK